MKHMHTKQMQRIYLKDGLNAFSYSESELGYTLQYSAFKRPIGCAPKFQIVVINSLPIIFFMFFSFLVGIMDLS